MTWRNATTDPPEPEVLVIVVRKHTHHGLRVGPMAMVAHRSASGEWWGGMLPLLGVYAWIAIPEPPESRPVYRPPDRSGPGV